MDDEDSEFITIKIDKNNSSSNSVENLESDSLLECAEEFAEDCPDGYADDKV